MESIPSLPLSVMGAGNAWHSLAYNCITGVCLHLHMNSPSISVPNLPPLSLRRILVIGFRAHPKSRIISSQDS